MNTEPGRHQVRSPRDTQVVVRERRAGIGGTLAKDLGFLTEVGPSRQSSGSRRWDGLVLVRRKSQLDCVRPRSALSSSLSMASARSNGWRG
jgi:hypothetical protein